MQHTLQCDHRRGYDRMKNSIRILPMFFILWLCFFPSSANAWFFFFFPIGGGAGASQPGDVCVTSRAQVGDNIPSPSGNNAIIKAISGKSSRCKEESRPILASVEFDFTASSKAGIEIPEGYESKPINEVQRYQGMLLNAEYKTNSGKGIIIYSRKRAANSDPAGIAQGIVHALSNEFADVTTENEEDLDINNMKALRFEIKAKVKGIFGRRHVYQFTILNGAHDYIIVDAYTPESDYEKDKDEMSHFAETVTGINGHKPIKGHPQ